MNFKFIYVGLFCALPFLVTHAQNNNAIGKSIAPSSNMVTTTSLRFIENVGQIKDQYGKDRIDLDFKLSNKGMNLFVGSGKIEYQWYRPVSTSALPGTDNPLSGPPMAPDVETYRVDLRLIGARPDAVLVKEGKTSYKEHYYTATSGEKGYHASGYQKLTYKNIYPQIDWVIYIKDQGIEYDFVVHPGGKVSDIRMEYKGANGIQTGVQGNLSVQSPFGNIEESAPYTYQSDGKTIASQFVVEGNKVGFATAEHQGVLTIDPKVRWGTYYGGTFMFDDMTGVETDSKGYVYCSGQTTSSNIATTGAFQNIINGLTDAYLVKFNPLGTPEWATFYGGDGLDRGYGVTLDSLDNVYLYLGNSSPGPGLVTTGAHQVTPGGGWDLIVAKFDEHGARKWATYYGGSSSEDNASFHSFHVVGNALYLYATTNSPNNIATPGAYQVTMNADYRDAFLVKFTLDGQRLWGTYLGGEDHAVAGGMCSDRYGNIYLCGTMSAIITGLGTAGTHQPEPYKSSSGGYIAGSDFFLAKFDTEGRKLWGTYYGGEGQEETSSIICDDEGNVYLTGVTRSTINIATANSLQPQINNKDLFDFVISKFDGQGKQVWGTYLGGTGGEAFPRIEIMNGDHLVICGNTTSLDIKVTPDALQTTNAGGTSLNMGDWYIAKLDFSGKLLWSSYYGGPSDDIAYSLCPVGADLYVCGNTNSDTGVTTPGSHQPVYSNPMVSSGLLVKFCFSEVPASGFIQGADTVCANSTSRYQLSAMEGIDGCIWTLPDGWSGDSDSTSIDVTTNELSGSISVQIIRCGDTSAASLLPIYLLPANTPVITVDSFVLGTTETYSSYQWYLNGVPIPGATDAKYTVTENGDYSVVTTNSHQCSDTSDVYVVRNVSIASTEQVRLNIRVYPNPASDYLHVQAPSSAKITISSIEGKALLINSPLKKIAVSSWASGMYLIHVQDQNGLTLWTNKWLKR